MTTPQNALELAKQGDPQAIAHLINQTLQPKGITARVTRKAACLRVMLESEQIPDQPGLVAYLQKNLAKLAIPDLASVELYGKQACAATPAWNQRVALEYSSLSSPSPALEQPSQVDPFPQFTPPIPVKPGVAGASVRSLSTRRQTKPPRTNPHRAQQIFLAGLIAFILILVGANLRAVNDLLSKGQSPKGGGLSQIGEGIHQAEIIGRARGVPIILVTFNGSRAFPMVVDTGASGTLITQAMASDLGVAPMGKVGAQTPNGYTTFDIGYVNSIEVDGAKINNIPVAIGLPDMDVGLLGHDFFGKFDVTVRENTVEFRARK